MEFDEINLKMHDLYLAQFPYLDFNYVILWPQMQTNINRAQSGCNIMWIHVERTIINNTTQIWTLATYWLWPILLLAFCKHFAFISIRKEAIDKIQIRTRSRNDASSSKKNSFLGNWSHAVVHRLTTACDQNIGQTFTKVNFKKVARPLTKLFFFFSKCQPDLY